MFVKASGSTVRLDEFIENVTKDDDRDHGKAWFTETVYDHWHDYTAPQALG